MTKEITDILAAYEKAHQAGRRTALATVVHVEGSSYRRPGARMLVEDNGKITGAISGGCLEGDALRRALLAITQQQAKLVTYDTQSEDDIEFGVQLGCNGIVHILFEPIFPGDENNPIALLKNASRHGRDAVVATLFSLQKKGGPQPGTCFLLDAQTTLSKVADVALEEQVRRDAAQVLDSGASMQQDYAESELSGFVELVKPPVSLVIVGAGNDAMPVVELAAMLGWQTTVVDGRSTHATVQRFPKAGKVIVGKPAAFAASLPEGEQAIYLLMTHNYNYDLEMLTSLLPKNCRYIGALGPKKRLERMLNDLQQQGIVPTEEQRAKIYGPTGLDIGAEASEEIALSVLAEIKAVLAGRRGGFLRDRIAAIHAPAAG